MKINLRTLGAVSVISIAGAHPAFAVTITGSYGEAVVQVNGTYGVPAQSPRPGMPPTTPGIAPNITVKRPQAVKVRYQDEVTARGDNNNRGIDVIPLTPPYEKLSKTITKGASVYGVVQYVYDVSNVIDPIGSLGYSDADFIAVCTDGKGSAKPMGSKIKYGTSNVARAASGLNVVGEPSAATLEKVDSIYVPLYVVCNLAKPFLQAQQIGPTGPVSQGSGTSGSATRQSALPAAQSVKK